MLDITTVVCDDPTDRGASLLPGLRDMKSLYLLPGLLALLLGSSVASGAMLTLPLTSTGPNTYQDASGISLVFSAPFFFTPAGVYTDSPVGLPGLNTGGSVTIAIPSTVSVTALKLYDLDALEVDSPTFDEASVTAGSGTSPYSQNFNIDNAVAYSTDVVTVGLSSPSSITIDSTGDYGLFFFDLDFTVDPVSVIPEPTSFVVMGLTFLPALALGTYRRRRKNL